MDDDTVREAQVAQGAAAPADQPQPPQGGAVRVYERPKIAPSVLRRRRLTLIMMGVGLLISLLLLAISLLAGGAPP
jgi:hypothetical protein